MISPGGIRDEEIKNFCLKIVGEKHKFNKIISIYNKIVILSTDNGFNPFMKKYRNVEMSSRELMKSVNLNEIEETLKMHDAINFNKIYILKSAIFPIDEKFKKKNIHCEVNENEKFWLQGASGFNGKFDIARLLLLWNAESAMQHELLHLGARINKQRNTIPHECVVSIITTPMIFWLMFTTIYIILYLFYLLTEYLIEIIGLSFGLVKIVEYKTYASCLIWVLILIVAAKNIDNFMKRNEEE